MVTKARISKHTSWVDVGGYITYTKRRKDTASYRAKRNKRNRMARVSRRINRGIRH